MADSVTPEQNKTAKAILKTLKELRLEVISRSGLLPTMEGFFFGSTDYDEGYFGDVEHVLKYCEETLLPMFDNLYDRESIYFSTWY